MSTPRYMAVKGLGVDGLAIPKRSSPTAQYAFAAFLLLVFVGLEPFKERDLETLREVATGEGDIIRQISYLIAFAAIVGLSARTRGARAFNALPPLLLPILLWCLLSTLWSLAPEITLRRAGLTSIIVITVFLAVDMLGVERSLSVLRATLAGLLIVNILAVLLYSQATHLPGEYDPALVGNWRGLHYHKNIAGPLCALSALLFLHLAIERQSRADWLLFLLAVVFTAGTRSKTAMGLLLLVIVIGFAYRHSKRNPGRRRLFNGLFVLLLMLAASMALIFQDAIANLLNDPEILTGRGAIWHAVMEYVSTNPLLGAGFGAFWQSGMVSPVLALTEEAWLLAAAHSHNGYLEILVTTGAIGFFLALLPFVVWPLKEILSFRAMHSSLLICWVSFILLLNLTETRFLDRDRSEWVIFLIALALLYRGTLNKRNQVSAIAHPRCNKG